MANVERNSLCTYNIESYKKEKRYRSQKEGPRKKLSVLIRFVKSFYDCPYHTLHILNSREKNCRYLWKFFSTLCLYHLSILPPLPAVLVCEYSSSFRCCPLPSSSSSSRLPGFYEGERWGGGGGETLLWACNLALLTLFFLPKNGDNSFGTLLPLLLALLFFPSINELLLPLWKNVNGRNPKGPRSEQIKRSRSRQEKGTCVTLFWMLSEFWRLLSPGARRNI